jgi:conjugal transfer pilus assembly protein TraF
MLRPSHILLYSASLVLALAAATPAAEVGGNTQLTGKAAVTVQAPWASDEQLTNYYKDAKRGWYWYEKQPSKPDKKEEEKKQAKRKVPSLKDYAKEDLWNMHPDDFQPLLKEFHKKAVQTPSEQNVYEYYAVQDIARRKALAYTNVSGLVMQKYPELSVATDYPVATPGRNAIVRQQAREIGTKIREAKDDYALLYFYSPDCAYCVEQDAILQFFVEKYGWEIKKLDIERETRLAGMFNITGVPRLILIYRKSQDYLPITAGVASMAEIEEKVFRGMRLLAGEITPEEYSIYEFQKGGTFDVKKPLQGNQR